MGLRALESYEADRYRSGEYLSLYRGLPGLVMRSSHWLMERGISPAQNAKVLEIGGGGMPHYYWMNASAMRSYTISDRIGLHEANLQKIEKLLPETIQLALHDFETDPALSMLEGGYSRIVASHVLEHIPNPEQAIVRWAELLADEGVLSIAVPCDPGWGWRFGQMMAYRSYKLDISFREYDLLMAREHVNSAQRLLKILRYYFDGVKCRWFPLMAPVIDFNLVCSITLNKRDYKH